MARPRRQYTLDHETIAIVERHATQYFDGNESRAVEALIQAGKQAQRLETMKGLAYAATATAAILVLLVL